MGNITNFVIVKIRKAISKFRLSKNFWTIWFVKYNFLFRKFVPNPNFYNGADETVTWLHAVGHGQWTHLALTTIIIQNIYGGWSQAIPDSNKKAYMHYFLNLKCTKSYTIHSINIIIIALKVISKSFGTSL